MRAAIFDLDGTVLDSMDIWYDAAARYLHSIDVEPEKDLGDILFPMTMEEAAAYAKEHYHLQQSEKEIIDGVLDIVRDFYYDEVQEKDGVTDFLRQMYEQGIPMVAATAGNRELAEAALTKLGILKYFQGLLTCTEEGAGKHEPDLYLKALEILGTEPEETFVFEDVLYALETAKKAGFRTVGIEDEGSLADRRQIKAVADSYLERWEEAFGLLDKEKENGR